MGTALSFTIKPFRLYDDDDHDDDHDDEFALRDDKTHMDHNRYYFVMFSLHYVTLRYIRYIHSHHFTYFRV